eukprot:TRINITY_DN4112_c0_g1_i2.p1 TRINITY_DN4112_c0_g1~~TRINITY_DN4112_c0_g1_i2.p1  ORF type:complete len:293 (+),score=47.27 TRINITY_DN4112_c0_g1_i2:111-881(+)
MAGFSPYGGDSGQVVSCGGVGMPQVTATGPGADVVGGRRFDAQTEARIDDWRRAKSRRDYAESDAIRQELRQKGIDPETELKERAETEKLMMEWRAAKGRRDFQTSDALRAQLRSRGIDPDQPRREGPRSGSGAAPQLTGPVAAGVSGGAAPPPSACSPSACSPAPGGGGLPPGWEEIFDDQHRRPYWYNAATGESTWTRPQAPAPAPAPAPRPPPPPGAPPSGLPPGWEEVFDENHRRPYWYHAASGQSTWERPR